ncbi:MAG: methyltransferase domain-containing protein, partial [Acidimicrobiia bacterium]|nr:methyltransferase domain-containing protein [Acidimicrobiia bacterium]
RDTVLRRLSAQPGDRILDVGSGPGFYVEALARQVGPSGSVVGVDPSEAMLETSGRRLADLANVELRQGAATALPVEADSFDRALSVQVLEYVEDVPKALGELYRVLRPGGRVVLWDIDWATVSWYSENPERMAAVLHAWDEHLADPSLPQTLPASLAMSGFEEITVDGHATVNTHISDDGYSKGLLRFVSGYAAGRRGCTQDMLDDWAQEQKELDAAGRFSFSVIQFCFSATKPTT